ncbi:MAG: hypothetical protein OEW11_11270 [Nitrospirota bacterium]|nr:hypothetical protein [Nitrospirota bacterium]
MSESKNMEPKNTVVYHRSGTNEVVSAEEAVLRCQGDKPEWATTPAAFSLPEATPAPQSAKVAEVEALVNSTKPTAKKAAAVSEGKA